MGSERFDGRQDRANRQGRRQHSGTVFQAERDMKDHKAIIEVRANELRQAQTELHAAMREAISDEAPVLVLSYGLAAIKTGQKSHKRAHRAVGRYVDRLTESGT